MSLMVIEKGDQSLFVPTTRMHLVTETLDAIKSGKATTIAGDASALEMMQEDFKDIELKEEARSNKGYVDFSTSYSQDKGFGFGGTLGYEWAKRQEQMRSPNKVLTGFQRDNPFTVQTKLDPLRNGWAKRQEEARSPNKGHVDFSTSYSQDKGFGFDGTIGYEWAKRQEEENRGTATKIAKKRLQRLLKNAVSVTVSVTVSCAKEGENKNVHMKIIDTNFGRIYLPSRHEDTFQNFEQQILSGEAKLI